MLYTAECLRRSLARAQTVLYFRIAHRLYCPTCDQVHMTPLQNDTDAPKVKLNSIRSRVGHLLALTS